MARKRNDCIDEMPAGCRKFLRRVGRRVARACTSRVLMIDPIALAIRGSGRAKPSPIPHGE